MIHPDTELRFINNEKGIGVVATSFIPKGTITWIFDPMDQVLTPEDLNNMHPFFRNFMDKYTYRDHEGNFILCWDHARFVNHSFNANCISTAYNFELAVRDILPGEELTDDYGYLNVSQPFRAAKEEGSDREFVMPDDILHYWREWDEKLRAAFTRFNFVEQPLWQFIDPKYEQKVRKVALGYEDMDSTKQLYYDPDHDNRLAA